MKLPGSRSLIKMLVVSLLLNSTLLVAQPFVDVFNLKMQTFSPQPYDADQASRLSGYQQEATFLLPLEQKNKDLILVGGDYTKLHFKKEGSSNEHINLFSTSLLLGIDHGFKNKNWRMTFLIMPKINSDYKDISMSDAQLGGFVLFNYKKKENLHYHFGLYYNREFFGNYYMPLVGIEWKINKRLNIFGDLPNNLNIEYKVAPTVYAGASFLTVISSYRLNNASGGMYIREGDKSMGRDDVKLYLNSYFSKSLMAYLEVGQSFYRTYTLFNNANELQAPPTIFRKSHNGMFITVGMAYRFRLD